MGRRAVSIQDIAASAGVSHSTVSRALHNSSLISPEMRHRIQQLAQEMGYTPNAVAQSLKGQRTNTVGLVITSIADPFVGRVVAGSRTSPRPPASASSSASRTTTPNASSKSSKPSIAAVSTA